MWCSRDQTCGVAVTRHAVQRRFFKSRDLHELFSLTDEGAPGTETGDLFADIADEVLPYTALLPDTALLADTALLLPHSLLLPQSGHEVP
jgi:hypothetical protein